LNHLIKVTWDIALTYVSEDIPSPGIKGKEHEQMTLDIKGDTATSLVLWASGNRADVLVEGEEIHLFIPGRWRLGQKAVRSVVPGDKVMLRRETGKWRMIRRLPRKNEFTRRMPGTRKNIPQTIAANIDRVIIVASSANPTTPNGLIDRLLVTAMLGGVPPVLLVNKIDLATADRLSSLQRVYKNAADGVFFTSAVTGVGVDDLSRLIYSGITLLAGSSGVGKSTLINLIDPDLDLKTGEISRATGKGRHITSEARLHRLKSGGWIIDTPGLRECEPWRMTRPILGGCFREFEKLTSGCHFRDCLHDQETGCAVKLAVGTDVLPEERYLSYLKLLHEVRSE